MTDVFLTRLIPRGKVSDIERVRRGMYEACYRRWQMEPGKFLSVIGRFYKKIEFQRDRRMIAEKKSTTEFYVLADDDCLLESMEPCLNKAVDIMQRHPGFAMLSWKPINADIISWRPIPEENKSLVGGDVFEDDEVAEHVSVGGIRLIRKGAMKDWPALTPNRPAYDNIHCARLRELGWRSGYFRNLRQLHIGRHYSFILNVPIDEAKEYTPEVEAVLGFRPDNGAEGVITKELLDQLRSEYFS